MTTGAEPKQSRNVCSGLASYAWPMGLLLALAALALSVGCDLTGSGGSVFDLQSSAGGAQTLAQQSPMTYTLTLLHTNDTWGYVDPCG